MQVKGRLASICDALHLMSSATNKQIIDLEILQIHLEG